MLLNDYLSSRFNFPSGNYFAVLGPCHAEEVAAEKLSYLTFAGTDDEVTSYIASCFRNHYLNTVTNSDIYGVQYASVLKNIYAVGSGMAHGLDYGDNFQSVFISNCAKEMASLLKISNLRKPDSKPEGNLIQQDYSASVYLGDLLVTCYSLYSRNRTLGNMIGKGYSVQSAKLEMNMIAEGYLASKCIHTINQSLNAELPIADTIYRILWEQLPARDGFRQIETLLV
jgi:glycerol-3-phosphate dehydrogenase (NAD(P)+)